MPTELVTTGTAPSAATHGEALLAALDATPGKLPEAAIRDCQRHRDLVTPLLIREIQRATDLVRNGEEVDSDVHWLALYLLWEFQAREALPAILAAVSLPDEGPFDLFGDAITEDLHRVLATLAGDRLDLIDTLIANPNLNEYVRSAAANVYIDLVREGKFARADAVERLRGHLRRSLDDEDQPSIEHLVMALARFWPQEARAEIEEAFAKELVDPMWIDLDMVRESLAAGEARAIEQFADDPPAVNADTVEEMRSWTWPGDRPPAPQHPPRSWGEELVSRFGLLPADDEPGDEFDPLPNEGEYQLPSGTIVREAPRVGRNDPCPCGSGKKYKKCCLRSANSE